MTNNDYHVPVMLEECIDYLSIKPDGIYVDVTLGAGGHTARILHFIGDKGHLYSFDQDDDALSRQQEQPKLTLIKSNFRHIRHFMTYYGHAYIDGILADLGVSSHQFDVPERGFSYRFDAPLDMRMNQNSQTKTAQYVLATYDEPSLIAIFSAYGEVRNARTLAQHIVRMRSVTPILTTFQFNTMLEGVVIGPRNKYLAQVYQSLRMEVNDEITALKEMLTFGAGCLAEGGRFVVMTYHSIEDRVVKQFFKNGYCGDDPLKDDYGRIFKPFTTITKNVVTASKEELKKNPRAASAKLRCIEMSNRQLYNDILLNNKN